MAENKDYYHILGIAKNASKDEIKSAYRKLALKYHPDRNPGDAAAEAHFKEVTHAYTILSDDEKRAAYDRFGAEGVNASAGFGEGFGGFSDVFSDIFEDFFGVGGRGARGGQRATRGSDLGVELPVTFQEAIEGVQKEIKVAREEVCRQCRGDGAEPGSKRETCRQCRGTGQVSVASGFFSITRACATCRGEGSVVTKPCSVCKGGGVEEIQRKMTVRVPPGVDNGTRLRISGEGEAGRKGGTRGDLYVDIFVEPHPIFKRHGTDVLIEMPISFAQAALGAEITIPTPYGTDALKIPAGTQTGKVFRIKGKGAPALGKAGQHGDLHARVVVETPTGLSARQKELLTKFAEAAGEKVNPIAASFMEKMKEFLKV